jgi:LmbE family N-acetylglucosaminyl deacetylase
MKVLAIGAHPDDVEYGCGGALVRHVQQGDEVYHLVMTDGECGGDATTRRQEQLDAARIVGVREVFFAGYPDTRFECNRESIMRIEAWVRQVGPDLVYTHFGEDTHQDHRQVSLAAVPAARSVPSLLFFEGLSAQDFSPTVFVDIGRVIHQKLAALEAHGSQVQRTNIQSLSILDIARSAAHFRGIQGRVTYAEGFVALRYFVDFGGKGE